MSEPLDATGGPVHAILADDARDRLYAQVSVATSAAGRSRESLFLARLALLLFEVVGDEDRCSRAIEAALDGLPEPSLSAGTDDTY